MTVAFVCWRYPTKHYTLPRVPERLRRLEEIFVQTPIYFVTASTNKRQKILATDYVHTAIRKFAESGEQHGAWLGAYILMPDHLHLFVALDPTQQMLSRWMKSLKNSVSKTLREHGVASPHWQKGFFDHLLRSDDSYCAKWHYVRQNAVRFGLVKRWEEWPFVGEVFDLRFGRG